MERKMIFIIFIAFIMILLKCTKSLATDIPKVYFEGDISNMETKQDERRILIKYTSAEVNFEKYAKIKIQGSSSLAYEKKNYNINLYEDDTYDEKSKVDVGHGWGSQSKYCLKANWIDKTHARNIVSARIVGKVQRRYNVLNNAPNNGSIDGFPVEIYINNEFLGLYTWNIPKDAWTWNMDTSNPNHIVLGGGWFTDQVAFKTEIETFDETGWEVEVGTANQETIDNFNRLVRFINNSSDEEFVRDFDLYLDKDACLNYLVMVYMIEGVDNTGKNLMLTSYNNGQTWYPCLYDLDATFGTLWDGTLCDSYEYLPEDVIADHIESNLFSRITKCFSNEIAKRWFSLRMNIFSKESILKEFNNFINGIPEEIYQKEADKWGDIPGYGIDQIEEFLDFRLPYIDNIMINMYTINLEDCVYFLGKSIKTAKSLIFFTIGDSPQL